MVRHVTDNLSGGFYSECLSVSSFTAKAHMSDTPTPQEKLSSLGTDVSGAVNDALRDARPALHRMADRVSDSMHDMAIHGKDAVHDAEQLLEKQTRHVRVTAEHYIQHAPFKSVLMAAGTGALTALVASWVMRANKH